MPGTASFGSHQSHDGFSRLCRTVLDHLDRGVIVLTGAGQLVDANRPARQLLDAGIGLAIRNDRLTFAAPRLESRFMRLLESRRQGRVPKGVTGRIDLGDRSQPLRVLVSPISVADCDSVAFLVFVYKGPMGTRISADVLRELYQLSRAEADVTVSLFRGLSVEQTARELNLSPNTIRTHLKHVFTKCGVQSQAELLHLLALGPRGY